jgi:heme oxygenase
LDSLPEIAALPRTADLTQRMRERTADLHTQAERGGIVAAILSGKATEWDYALYLRNLLPAYQAMEQGLRRRRGQPGFCVLARRSLHRASRIAADLDILCGPGWLADLPLLVEGEIYAARVAAAGRDGGALLVAHAYTRYLGDLSGGQIMRKHLMRQFGPAFRATAFTEFPTITAIGEFVTVLRAALSEAGGAGPDGDRVVEEAAVAFRMNIQVSEGVAAFGRRRYRH